MSSSIETWQSYGALLERLFPNISQCLLADADGAILWASDPGAAALLQPTLARLSSATHRPGVIDGLADLESAPAGRYGFRVRDALGEILGSVVAATPTMPDLAAVHTLIKPALDCLQSELAARAAIGALHADATHSSRNLDLLQRLTAAELADGVDALEQIPTLALEYLPGIVAAVLLPERNLSICRTRPGQPRGIDADTLVQLHRHLMTRAQLHGCTLVANRLALEGSNDALPYKGISTPIRDALQCVVGVLAVFRDDTDADFQLHDAEVLELLARQAAQIVRTSFDFGTGLLTHAAFVAQTKARLARSSDCASPDGLLYIDIDQLNIVNENHGMPVGDEVIAQVAAVLARRARAGTLVARLAGDRFALFVPGCGIEPAARIAEELRGCAVKLSGVRGDKPLHVSLSIGVARIGDRDRCLEHAMAAAEQACRTAKERGRNRVEVFYGGGHGVADRRSQPGIVAQLKTALATDSLELLAQPILPLGSAPADPRFEVLLRLRATDGTRLCLEKSLIAAASPELTRRIDRWAVEQTIARLVASGATLAGHPARFFLNLSAASLGDAEFWAMLEAAVQKARIAPGTLNFEFTEDAAGGQIGRVAPLMSRLRDQGVSFAVDDFGGTISSLAHLLALPVSCIKIGGLLSRDLVHNPRSRSMVCAIATLAHKFGQETVASQIETDAIRSKAAELGVDFGQGFFIGKPLSLDDVIRDLPLYSCFASSLDLFDGIRAPTPTLSG